MIKGGLKMAFMIRLTPGIPFIVLNYLLSLTKISMKDYCLGTIGLIPMLFVFVMVGTTVTNIQNAAHGDFDGGIGMFIFMGVMTLAGCSGFVYMTVTVSKYMKIALQEEQDALTPTPDPDIYS
jgi:uncharacterized membrane protein YdjX (TVP38/TMEM64 family)